MKVDVALLPINLEQVDITDKICIILDVFRATTSIVTAMSNGCKNIFPVSSLDIAKALGKQISPVLFAGERQSVKIAGFDFGNSPLEFTPEAVRDKSIIMTTSNGTIAIEATKTAKTSLIGSFINAKAVCQQAVSWRKDIIIVCAGTDRQFSLEDAVCAGALVDNLSDTHMRSDSAIAAYLMYKSASENLKEFVSQSKNGKRLLELGYLDDLNYCLQKDLCDVVPVYRAGKISIF